MPPAQSASQTPSPIEREPARAYTGAMKNLLDNCKRAITRTILAGAICALAGCNSLVLDNGVLRVKASLDYGGALTYLSLSGQDRNLINNSDRGRQVQQSYYAGKPLDRRGEDQAPYWSPWPWNPISAGDAYGNKPKLVEFSNKDGEIYVKAIPLLWDMNNEFAECTLETWIRLEGSAVHVRNRLSCHRTDTRWTVNPCDQELPAVYTIGDLPRLYTYEGPAPFTNGELTQISDRGIPWAYWGSPATTEKWAAHVDDRMWGVGVYNRDMTHFVGGFYGPDGGGTNDESTGYLSPLKKMALEKDSVFEYDFWLIVGALDEIRAFVYRAEAAH